MTKSVLKAEVAWGWEWGRLRLCGTDGMKAPLGSRQMAWRSLWAAEGWHWNLHDNVQKIEKSGEPSAYVDDSVSCGHFCFTCSFGYPPMLWWIITWRGSGMPLHDAIGVNYKKGCNYWKSRCMCLVYGLRGVCWIIVCSSSDLTWLTLSDAGRKSWYIINIYIFSFFQQWRRQADSWSSTTYCSSPSLC